MKSHSTHAAMERSNSGLIKKYSRNGVVAKEVNVNGKLNEEADINSHDKFTKTPPLHLFLEEELRCEIEASKKLLQLLIDKCTSVDFTSKVENWNADTALFDAVVVKNVAATRILLEAGANPNYKSQNSETILSRAVFVESETIVKLLLRHKVNTNDAKAIEDAAQHDSKVILRLILENGNGLGKIDPPDDYLQEYSNAQWVLQLLKRVINGRYLDTLEYLLDNALDIDIFNADPEKCILRQVYLWLYVKELGKYYPDEGRAYKSMLTVILKHLAIVMEIGDITIGKSTLRWVQGCLRGDEHIQQDLEVYLKQIRFMKTSFVCENSHFTYFDLLTRRGKQLIKCCGEQIVDALTEDKLNKLFPDFSEKVMNNVRRGVLGRTIVMDYQKMLYNLLQRKLSFDLICCICDFLQMNDCSITL